LLYNYDILIRRYKLTKFMKIFVDSDKKFVGLNRSKGFTLIELLVVISIIGILASIFIVGLGGVREKARDTKRIADLRQVQNALELYYSKEEEYPKLDTWSGLQTTLIGASIGITKLPNDADTSYDYGSTDGTSYVLKAKLEVTGNPALNDDVDNVAGATVQGVDCADPNYCLQF